MIKPDNSTLDDAVMFDVVSEVRPKKSKLDTGDGTSSLDAFLNKSSKDKPEKKKKRLN